jgi:2-octaprenyl-6-methoxyphenol hydroxylase
MHDVLIVGAGPVGATLALALAGHDLDVIVVDARARNASLRGDRSLALSHGARLILERVGVWAVLEASEGAVTAIREIDVSQARGFGVTRLYAHEQRLPALGYVVSYLALQSALDAALQRSNVAVRFETSVDSVSGTPHGATVQVHAADASTLQARLVAVADGAGTVVPGIERIRHEYGQVALVAKVWMDSAHRGVAYERFTSEGPVALLPEHDRYGLVWTTTPRRGEALLALDERSFLEALAAHFGMRVRGFARVADRRAFPLVLERAQPTIAARSVVLGNAAQQLHPVAGQGFNLGLRDAWELAQCILDEPRERIGAQAMLAHYAAQRRADRSAGIAFTHGLVRVFGNDIAWMRWPRGLALAALDALPPVKRAFTRAMLFGVH